MKKGPNIYISIIDIGCYSPKQAKALEDGIYYLFNKRLNLFDLTFHFKHEYNDYVEKKALSIVKEIYGENFTLDQYQEVLTSLCTGSYQLQYPEESLFQGGFCISWGLYFIYKMYSDGISVQTLYEDIYNMVNRAKFIYIWHDLFFDRVLRFEDQMRI
jgi:hypothetical protein